MSALFYIRLVGFAAGSLLHLFLLALIAGHRRPRAFDRLLFLLLLGLFLFYSGGLLAVNASMHYAAPPLASVWFAMGLVGGGLALVPPLLVHAHVEYGHIGVGTRWTSGLKLLVAFFYFPVVYFLAVVYPRLFAQPSLELLWPGSRVGIFYGAWLGSAFVVSFFLERRATQRSAQQPQRRLHKALTVFFAVMAPIVFYTYAFSGPRNPVWAAGLGTAVMLSALVPSALLGYYVLRYNFLEIGLQRNLVYAVSAAFLALLYLAVVRRVSGWLEPVLPPEATASILLFVLVIFFEPLERSIGRVLYRTFQARMDRVQRLSVELQEEARHGDLDRLVRFAERRIRDEFGLAEVRISIPRGPSWRPLRAAGGLGHAVEMPLRKERVEIGVLEACSTGAVLTGETSVALEFLAEQLPAAVDLCRLIEEKLKLERELAERERLALVGQMAASISHNLRNPLSSMKTVLQALLEDGALPGRVREDCAMVVGEVDRLAGKLGQLLRYAKPSVRRGAQPQQLSAVALVEQVVALLGRDAERRRVTLELERPAEEMRGLGSEEALSDIISNLVVNAIEAQPGGGRVRVSLRRENSRLVMDVSDDGAGIPAELQPKVFQPFFTTKPSGTGLGLAIVARRLAEMDGSISWESPVRDGKGTRFTVTLPLADDERAS